MFPNKLTAANVHVKKEMHNECKSARNKYEIQKK